MIEKSTNEWVTLNTKKPIWKHFYTVAPLVVIGTREGDNYDLAPKHMVTPLGHENFFGFVCTPRHSTYQNVLKEKEFTVSFIKPDQVVLASLAASPRCGGTNNQKPIIRDLPTQKANHVDALYVEDSYLILECKLHQIINGFGEFSLVAGQIIEARVQRGFLKISEGDDMEMINKNPLLAFLPYGRFTEIRKTMEFPLPKDFQP